VTPKGIYSPMYFSNLKDSHSMFVLVFSPNMLKSYSRAAIIDSKIVFILFNVISGGLMTV
jgi:hypothetical protein